MSDRSWHIYTLEDPRGGGVRYVGVTHHTLKHRLSTHLSRSSKVSYHSARWVRKVLSSGATPLIKSIHIGTGVSWGSVEAWWIQWHLERGFHLTNVTKGGEGAPGRTTSIEARAKLSAANKGRERSLEYRARSSLAHKGYRHTAEAREKNRRASTGRKHSDEARAKLSALAKGREFSAETRAKLSAASQGKKQSAETRAKIGAASRGLKRSPETRAKMSASAKLRVARRRQAELPEESPTVTRS